MILNLKEIVGKTLWIEQLKAMGVTIFLAVVGTAVLAFIVKAVVGLRPSEEVETARLDLAEQEKRAITASELNEFFLDYDL